MIVEALAASALAAAALPLAMVAVNLNLYRRVEARRAAPVAEPEVAVCIPARDEAANIRDCLEGILASENVAIEVLVYDDQSVDGTGSIVDEVARRDPRCRRVPTVELAAGWNGKQWGCEQMGRHARAPWLLFTDADVRFAPAAAAAAVQWARASGSDLVSTFPRQVCGTPGESLVVPLIHFMLLGYLPIALMRRSDRASLGAGCGQFLLVRRDAWTRAGGHGAIRASMHDGIQLPRAIRRAGGRTDLFDGTDLLQVRMYRGFAATWRGFTKNAYEGLGSMAALLFFTAMHAVGHLAPPALLLAWGFGAALPRAAIAFAAAALAAGVLTRAMLAARFRQPWIGVALHPVGVLLMTAIQWRSWWLHRRGRRLWRGRVAGA